MTFAQYASRSVSDARVLVELDLGTRNLQWVNNGAGIWCMEYDGVYDWVDASLLDGFTAQIFGDIGSLSVNGIQQTRVTNMLDLVATHDSFWYDETTETLWLHTPNNDSPYMMEIFLGIVYGYSFYEFTPVGDDKLYEGRLLSAPEIARERDPLYFGRVMFGSVSIDLANGDGFFDTFAETKDVYGNPARIYLGYADLTRDDYLLLYTGQIEEIVISEELMSVGVVDKRKALTAPVTYSCVNLNALSAIVEILQQSYPVTYNDTYFDTTAWAAASASVENVTITMAEPDATITVIEKICMSVFGYFFVTADNRFSFKLIDTAASSVTTIHAADILNQHEIVYDPTEVLSSARIGYWAGSVYTYLTNTVYETSVQNTYKTLNQKDFETHLDTATAATALGETIIVYTKDVHGQFDIVVPMAHYVRDIGETVDVEVYRGPRSMIGTKKAEILAVAYNLEAPNMTLGCRIV